MNSSPATSPTTPPLVKPPNVLRRWKKWFRRLEVEFHSLLVHHRHYLELVAVYEPYASTERGYELFNSMRRAYSVAVCAAIRRITDDQSKPRKEVISLPILLMDIQKHANLVTRQRQHFRYRRMKNFSVADKKEIANRAFDIACLGRNTLDEKRVNQEVDRIKRRLIKIYTLTSKTIAHAERDLRKIPRLTWKEIWEVIQFLYEILDQYKLCTLGRDFIVPNLASHSIARELWKIWPTKQPLPEFPPLREEEEL